MNCFERIKFHRERLSLSRKELAEEIGCSRQIVIRWESGLSVPSLYYAQKLAARFGITVTELMADGDTESEPAPLLRDCAERYDGDVKRKVGIFGVLSFVPFVLYIIFGMAIEGVRQYLILIGHNLATEYRSVTDLLENASKAVCIAFIAVLLFLWINELIACFMKNTDKYDRYIYLKNWNVGFFLILVNLLVLAASRAHDFVYYIILYVCAISAAAIVDGIAVFFIRLFGKKHVLFEQNKRLDKLNLIFFIIRAALFSALILLIVYAFAVSASAAPFAAFFYAAAFAVVVIILETVYLIIRFNLK